MLSFPVSHSLARPLRAALFLAVFFVTFGSASTANALDDPRAAILKDLTSSIDLFGAVVVPLDSQYVTAELYHFLDSCGVDSIRQVVTGFNRADTLFLRPDGVQVRLHDLSLYYKVFFAD